MEAYSSFLPSVRFRPSLAISPDHQQIAYVNDSSGQFNVNVQALRDGGPRQVTSYHASTVRWVCWHPDGRSLLFLVDNDGDECNQLHEVDVDGGPTRLLAGAKAVQYTPGFGPPFSPGGERLLYAGNDRSPADQDILIREIATGEVTRIYTGGGNAVPGYWSPDGTSVSVVEFTDSNSDHTLHLVRSHDGTTTRLTPKEHIAMYWPGPWLPNGTGFLVRSNAERDFTGLALIDVNTQRMSWLDTPAMDVEHVALSTNGRVLVWSVNDGGASRLAARDLAAETQLRVPELPAGVITALEVSAEGDFAVLLFSTPTKPQNLVHLDLRTGEVRWLTHSQPAATNVGTFVEPDLIRYPAEDGLEIPAYLYRPPSTTELLPVVLAIHGGPALQERPFYSNDGFFQYLVRHGVAVLAPNIRGSSGYGTPYQQLNYRDWGGGDLRDLAAAAKFLKQQSWVDPARIGVVGRSYGGFAALSCAARLPEVGWAAAVAWCGPSNLLTFARNQPATWRGAVRAMIGDPDEDEAFLMSRSPITYAECLRAPLLIIQGAKDMRVPKDESDQIVAKLRARGVEVSYEVYDDEGHRFGKRENQISAQTSAGEFLLRHLL